MTNLLILISFLAITAVSLYSVDVFKQAGAIKIHNEQLKQETLGLNKKIARLSKLPDAAVGDLSHSYANIYKAVKTLETFYGLKVAIEMEGLSPSDNLVSAAKPSPWEGVQEMPLKINFSDVAGLDQYLSILTTLTQLQQKNPVEITSLLQNADHMQVQMKLFGKGESA